MKIIKNDYFNDTLYKWCFSGLVVSVCNDNNVIGMHSSHQLSHLKKNEERGERETQNH